MRIVSLLPSATEIVCALGLVDELVGITHECDWPPEVVGLPVMTRSVNDLSHASSREIHRLVERSVHGGSSLYALDEAAMAAAEPDLILTQELCTVCAVGYREVNEVARRIDAEIAVVSLEPTSLEGILNTISDGRRDDRRRGRGRRRRRRPPRAARASRDAGRPSAGPPAGRRPGSSASNGSTHRSPSATGCPSRSAGPAPGTCWVPRASGRSRRPGTRFATSIRRCSS